MKDGDHIFDMDDEQAEGTLVPEIKTAQDVAQAVKCVGEAREQIAKDLSAYADSFSNGPKRASVRETFEPLTVELNRSIRTLLMGIQHR